MLEWKENGAGNEGRLGRRRTRFPPRMSSRVAVSNVHSPCGSASLLRRKTEESENSSKTSTAKNATLVIAQGPPPAATRRKEH